MQRLWAQTKGHGKQTGKPRAFLLSRKPIKINYSAHFFSCCCTKINSKKKKWRAGPNKIKKKTKRQKPGREMWGWSRRTTHWIIHECRRRKQSIVLYLISYGNGGWALEGHRMLKSDTKGMTIKNSKVSSPRAASWNLTNFVALPTFQGPRPML